jgi:3-phenylpropionate/trans-cinnamate dioxygenase ferredoxin reductase component
LRTLDDVMRLRSGLSPGSGVVVVGGGFIGCEVAVSLRMIGLPVRLVEMLSAPLVGALGPIGAEIVTTLHREHGVDVRTGVGVREILGEDAVKAVRLADGSELPASAVVAGVGVTPNVEWLQRSGIEVESGIKATSGGLTSLPRVFALGDVAAWYHPLAGGHRRIEHWTTAADQAQVVARNIMTNEGQEASLARAPYFWSDQYDVKIQALGFVDGSSDVECLEHAGRTVLLYSEGGTLTGVVGFSAPRLVMPLAPFIERRAEAAEARAKVLAL